MHMNVIMPLIFLYKALEYEGPSVVIMTGECQLQKTATC